MEIVKRADGQRDHADHQPRYSEMAVEIATEPRDALQVVRKIEALKERLVDVVDDRRGPIQRINSRSCSPVSGGDSIARIWPPIRTCGAEPVCKWTSAAW